MANPKHYDIIRRPIITEKATFASENGQVVMEVAIDANKLEIKQAIEALFDVKVKAVNTSIRKGKTKRFRGIRGRQNNMKKAVITLEEGQIIDVNEGL